MNAPSSAHSRGFPAVIGGAVAIGTAAIFMRLTDVNPTAAAFWRVTLALPLLYFWLKLDSAGENKRKQNGVAVKTDKRALVIGALIVGFWFSADLFLWHWSVAKTTVANATLLANMAAVFTALAGFLFFGQRFGRMFLSGLILALAGAAVLVGQTASINPDFLVGDVLGLLTAVAYAGYIIFAARYRGLMTTPQLMFGSAFTTAIFLLPVALFESGNFWPSGLAGWLPLLGLAWIAHIVGQSLIIYGLAHVSAAMGSISLLIQPVFSALLAWWIFDEALGTAHLVGALLIFAGISVARKAGRK